MAAAAVLDFKIDQILFTDGARRAQWHHCAKLRQNYSFHCEGIAIFRIFKVAVAAILDFRNCKILLAHGVQSTEMHHHSKFSQKWSIRCGDIQFLTFQDGGRPPHLICFFYQILHSSRSRGRNHL